MVWLDEEKERLLALVFYRNQSFDERQVEKVILVVVLAKKVNLVLRSRSQLRQQEQEYVSYFLSCLNLLVLPLFRRDSPVLSSESVLDRAEYLHELCSCLPYALGALLKRPKTKGRHFEL
jgi:hypothetical protein